LLVFPPPIIQLFLVLAPVDSCARLPSVTRWFSWASCASSASVLTRGFSLAREAAISARIVLSTDISGCWGVWVLVLVWDSWEGMVWSVRFRESVLQSGSNGSKGFSWDVALVCEVALVVVP